MTKLTVSDLIIKQLENWGVKRIYGVAGDTLLHFFNRLADYPQIQLITTRHESTAAFMASAEAKLTGQLAVCIAHNGPGVANLVNGLGDAYTDSCPVLVLTGQVESWNMGTDYKQYINQQSLLSAVTDFSEVIAHPESAMDLLTKAIRRAITGGTVTHLVIPRDIFPMTTDNQPREREPFIYTGFKSQEETLKASIALINQASKPVILVGRGGLMARNEIINFAEKIGAALITTLPGRGVIPSKHPHNLGGLGHAGSEASRLALEEADLVIILGATWWPYEYVPHKTLILQMDANPANLGSTKPIDFGLVGKIENLLPQLTPQVETRKDSLWTKKVKQLKTDWEAKINEEANNITSPLQPQTVIQELEKVIPADAIISLDVGDHVVWFNRCFRNQNQQILVSGRWRSMGFGLPAAAAAGLSYPEKPVVLITGDGGLSMILGDLVTLSRYQIPVKIFVLNNKALAMEMNRMRVSNLTINGVDLTNPDYAEIAWASGLKGYSVEEPDMLETTLRRAISESGPVLVDIQTADTIPPHTKL